MTKAKTTQKTTSKASTTPHVTKKDQLIKLLSAKAGADVNAISAKLGWQQHTTRAALTGLRKAGFEVVGEKPAKGGPSKYCILSAPKPAQAATPEAADAE